MVCHIYNDHTYDSAFKGDAQSCNKAGLLPAYDVVAADLTCPHCSTRLVTGCLLL